MGFFGFFGKVGKAVGKGVWWGVRRPEARLAGFFISPTIMAIVLPVVEALEGEDEVGQVKMAKALNILTPILLDKYIKDKAQIRALIEIALQIVREQATLEER